MKHCVQFEVQTEHLHILYTSLSCQGLSKLKTMRFDVLTAFWDITPCSLGVDGFRGAYCLHHHPDDGGSMHLQNGILRDHTAQYPRRLSSSTKTTPKLLEISEKREGKNLSFWLLNLHVYKVGNWKITVMVGHVHATALLSPQFSKDMYPLRKNMFNETNFPSV